jgi:hypothetical protein
MLYVPFFVGSIRVFDAVNLLNILKIPKPVLFIPAIIAYNNHGDMGREIGNPIII